MLLPLLLLAGLLTRSAVQAEQARAEQTLAATADGVLTVVNREVAGLIETLQTLETSPSLGAGDVAAFQQQITALAPVAGVHIVLRDPEGRVLASSLPPGELPPGGEPVPSRLDAAVLAGRGVVVSGFYAGPLSQGAVFILMMPVQRDGAVRYLLHLAPPVLRLQDILGSLDLDPGFRLAVLDRKGVVLARSHDHAAAVGRNGALPVPVDGEPPVHMARSTDHEGRDVYFHTGRTLHGWTIVTSLAAGKVDAPRRRMLVNAGLAAAMLTGIALVAVRVLGTRLAGAIRGLAAAGSALDRGAPVEIAPSGIREIDEVAAALGLAAERLRAAAEQRAAAAERQRLILHELNHRVKNTLAMVQALATLAARGAADVTTYRERLTERLHGLARTQALLTASDWTGAQLGDLLRAELGIYESGRGAEAGLGDGVPGAERPGDGGRIHLAGPPVRMPAHHVVAFGMLVHELATNAAKYGALSLPQGRLSVEWEVVEAERGAPWLELRWAEGGGPPVMPPAVKGFGTQMIERGLARQLGAQVASTWPRDGLRFHLRMPLRPAPGPGEGGAEGAGPDGPPWPSLP